MSATKAVEILMPTGRRHKIKTKPSMTVLQIIEEACQKEGLDDSLYELKHFNKVLPLTSIMRFLNFSNNAKLELVKASQPRTSGQVKVVLQTANGSRHQHTCSSTTTLHELLQSIGDSISEELIKPNAVCVYMSNEYKTMETLKRTSLKSMGIASGGALIRLLFRDDVIEPESNNPSNSRTSSHSTKENISPTKGPSEKKPKLEMTPSVSVDNDHVSPNQSTSAETSRDTLHEPQTLHSFATGPPPRDIFPANLHGAHERSHNVLPVEPYARPSEFANFKFPTKKNIEDEIVPIDPKEMKLEVELSMPCDREGLVFSMKRNSENNTAPLEEQDIDDNFFNVTIDDLRKRMNDLKSNSASHEDAMLMTKAMREREELRKIAHFQKIPIRFQFPDKIIVQGIFRPLEAVSSLRKFLQEYLDEKVKQYELFTTPPRVVLKDVQQTLHKAKLIPAALVHVSIKTDPPYLKPKYYEEIKTFDEVEELLHTSLGKHSREVSTTSNTSNLKSKYPAASQTTSDIPTELPTSKTTSSSKEKTKGGAPKWFKQRR